jgi:hypothetical protein
MVCLFIGQKLEDLPGPAIVDHRGHVPLEVVTLFFDEDRCMKGFYY